MSVLKANGIAAGPEFSTSRALSRTFRVLRRQGIPYALLCIATFVPPCLWSLSIPALHPSRFLMLLLLPVSFALVPLGSAMILLATMRELAGERPTLDAVARQAAARFLPLLACTACSWIAVAGGCVLLIVPGVIAAVVFSVAGQVCVAERLDPISSLERSAALTKGFRWRILGFYLAVAGILVALSAAEGLAEAGLGALGMLIGICFTGFSEAFWATACAVQYIDLRMSKDGIGTERIAAVFD